MADFGKGGVSGSPVELPVGGTNKLLYFCICQTFVLELTVVVEQPVFMSAHVSGICCLCFIKSQCHIKSSTTPKDKQRLVFAVHVFLLCGCHFLWATEVCAGGQIERTPSAGTRRGLGPGWRRGTIEVLCRSGGRIAALEIPSVVGSRKTQSDVRLEAAPPRFR